MKKCASCGALNNDQRSVCVDCGERLGAPLTEEQLHKVQEQLHKTTEKLYQEEDPLHISLLDKIVGGLCVFCMLAGVCLWILGFVQQGMGKYAFVGIGCLLAGSLECLVPALMWELYELRLSMVTDNATPGGAYGLLRRGGEIACLLFGVIFFLVAIFG
jgi:hypothetical protein